MRSTGRSPTEAMRVIGTSIQKAEEARRELALVLVKHGQKYPIDMPDISTKEKAQRFIGLDMKMLKEDKQEFLKTTAVEWDKKASERQGGTLNKY